MLAAFLLLAASDILSRSWTWLELISVILGINPIYRVTLVVSDLGWVDLDLGSSPGCGPLL